MNRHNTYSEYKTKSKHLTGAPVSSTLRSETHSCQKMTILGMTNTDKFNIRNTLCCHLTETQYFKNTFKSEQLTLLVCQTLLRDWFSVRKFRLVQYE